jgi:hypothetical protein
LLNIGEQALVQIAGAGKRPVFYCRDFKLGARHSTLQAQVDLERQGRSSRREDEYRSRSRHDEDRRYESRPRSDDDDDRRSSSGGRGHGGWSGDPDGHSEASRRGWDRR